MGDILVTTLVAVAATVGLAGVVVPILPGSLLIGGALIAWAVHIPFTPSRIVVGLALAVLLATQVVQYLTAGRSMRTAGVPKWSLAAGAVLAVVGFFVIPVIGLFLGFVLGIFLAEAARLRAREEAIGATKAALKAVGISMLTEILGACCALALWAVAAAWYFIAT